MHTRSTHILAEFRGCEAGKLNDLAHVESSMRKAATEARATIVNASFHQFGPQGVSGVLVLAESHLSVHTWPEHGYASADIYVCGDTCKPELAQTILAEALGAQEVELMTIARGLDAPFESGIRVQAHTGAPVGDSLSLAGARELAKPIDASAKSSEGVNGTRPGPE